MFIVVMHGRTQSVNVYMSLCLTDSPAAALFGIVTVARDGLVTAGDSDGDVDGDGDGDSNFDGR